MAVDESASPQREVVAELEAAKGALAACEAENKSLRARQACSVEVLKTISASPDDAQPVLELIVRHARMQCNAQVAHYVEYDGSLLHQRAVAGYDRDPEALARFLANFPRPAGPETVPGRAVLAGQPVHIPDIENDPVIFRPGRGLGARSYYAAPLLHDARIIGVLVLGRNDPGEYDQSAIELVQAFAGQAVIALSGAAALRALRERSADLQESLEYQTAISDVLKVISRSTFDLQPVLETLLNAAARLCDADTGGVATVEGDGVRVATHYSRDGSYRASTRGQLLPLTRATIHGRTVLDGRIVHVEDITADPEHVSPDSKQPHPEGTMLGVPLLRDGVVLGSIRLARDTVRPFTARQIELVSTFADQAVIAIENTRLLSEQREALERQTATAEVLQVINANPGNLAPVFDAMLEKAMRLCGVAFGRLIGRDGDMVVGLAARGLSPALAEWDAENRSRPAGPGAQLIYQTKRPFQMIDIRDTEGYRSGNASIRAVADLGNGRTNLMVPLVKDESVLGYFHVFRQEVRAFGDKEVALLESFAAQAVIAMENARLLTEQQEALERQTATAEVLQVINASPGNLAPVFDAMLEKAMRLCGAAFGMLRGFDGAQARTLATRGLPAAYAEYTAQLAFTPIPGGPLARALASGRPAQELDVREFPGYRDGSTPSARAIADLGGARTLLFVPLVKDGVSVGCFTIYRQEARAYADKEISLLESFAAQAVIAMENARLLTEQQEALERQAATAEILAAINRSPGDTGPAFDAILDRAVRLCRSATGSVLVQYDGRQSQVVATSGLHPAHIDRLLLKPFVPPPGHPAARVIESGRPVQIADVLTDPYTSSDPVFREQVAGLSGYRAFANIPLLKDSTVTGWIGIYRREQGEFSGQEIALLESFAAQAVIAMENARLLAEQREALERQTATAEVLAVINANPGNLTPVFEAMLEKGMTLCGAAFAVLRSYDGEYLTRLAARGVPAAYAEYLAKRPSLPLAGLAEALATGRPMMRQDMRELELYRAGQPDVRAIADLGGARTLVSVPLVKDRQSIGLLTFYRQEVRPFSDKEIALLESFAAQAVIAMENARLLGELRARTDELAARNSDFAERIDQQAATIDVLKVMSASPGDPQPVFDLIVRRAPELCNGAAAVLLEYDGTLVHYRARHSLDADSAAAKEAHDTYRNMYPMTPTRALNSHRAILDRRICHIRDLEAAPDSVIDLTRSSDARSELHVPLLRDGASLGVMMLISRHVGGFSDSQVELLQTFAEQAVIAIGAAAAFRALQQRTAELAQRQDELRVTFENMNDGVALFDEHQRLVAWNSNFLRILDLPEDALVPGRPFADYIRTLAERGEYGEGANVEEQVSRVLGLIGERRSFERGRPGGRTVEVRNNPVADGGFVLIYADITERKRAEEAVRAARDAAEMALRDLRAAQASLVQAEKMASLGQLTAGIAHEIKNPLNFINNFSALSTELIDELRETLAPAALPQAMRAEMDELTATLKGNLEKVVQHGRRADGIVRSMLQHSRDTTGERRAVDINALVEEALNLAYHGGRAQDQDFDVTLERAFDAGIAPIELAPQDMTRVILNLCANGFYAARKRQAAAAAGFRPVLKVSTHDRGDAVEIRVRDNGIGIPADIRDKLFQPFFTTKPTGEGTGLGLSITWDIVTKQHGGGITVDSEPGAFTEFTVTLPRDGGAR